MITLRLFGHETDANHIREEGRHCYLDRRGRLYDWRNDLRPLTMRRLLEPWTTQDDERLKAFATQDASVVAARSARRLTNVGLRWTPSTDAGPALLRWRRAPGKKTSLSPRQLAAAPERTSRCFGGL